MADGFASCPLVIDIGSSGFKCGFGGEDSPRGAEPCIYGEYHNDDPSGKFLYTGSEITPDKSPSPLVLKFGYWAGKFLDCDVPDRVYHRVFYHVLRVDPVEHPVLLADSLGSSKEDRERNISLMFETFDVPQLCSTANAGAV